MKEDAKANPPNEAFMEVRDIAKEASPLVKKDGLAIRAKDFIILREVGQCCRWAGRTDYP
jgi:hypothetical protein